MPVFDLDSLAEWSGGTWKNKPGDLISGFSIDNRSISAGKCSSPSKPNGTVMTSCLMPKKRGGACACQKADLRVIPQLVVDDTL